MLIVCGDSIRKYEPVPDYSPCHAFKLAKWLQSRYNVVNLLLLRGGSKNGKGRNTGN